MGTYTTSISRARISPLSVEERATTGFNTRFRLLYTDVAYAAATATNDTVYITLGASPTKWLVDKAVVNVTTAFAGVTALTVALGTTSNTTAFATAVSVKSTGTIQMASALPVLTNAKGTSALNLVAGFVCAEDASSSISALSAGQLDIYLNVLDTDKALTK